MNEIVYENRARLCFCFCCVCVCCEVAASSEMFYLTEEWSLRSGYQTLPRALKLPCISEFAVEIRLLLVVMGDWEDEGYFFDPIWCRSFSLAALHPSIYVLKISG